MSEARVTQLSGIDLAPAAEKTHRTQSQEQQFSRAWLGHCHCDIVVGYPLGMAIPSTTQLTS